MILNDLPEKALWLRQQVLEMSIRAKQTHMSSVMSLIEIYITLYYGGFLRYDPDDPDHPHRDKLIVSKGHATMGIYPILADLGFFDMKELDSFAGPPGLLKMFGHIGIPGVDATTGSLGHGLGVACGFAWAARQEKRDQKSFVIMSEGELYEGSVWESAMYAAHNEMDNIIAVIDRNQKIILGETEDLLRLEPIQQKWESFGWTVLSTDGHDFEDLHETFSKAGSVKGKPTVIIANTIKGKGISFMEDRHDWHYTFMDEEHAAQARKDLQIAAPAE